MNISKESSIFAKKFFDIWSRICILALSNALCEKVDRNLRVPISRIVLASLFEPRDFDFNNGTN